MKTGSVASSLSLCADLAHTHPEGLRPSSLPSCGVCSGDALAAQQAGSPVLERSLPIQGRGKSANWKSERWECTQDVGVCPQERLPLSLCLRAPEDSGVTEPLWVWVSPPAYICLSGVPVSPLRDGSPASWGHVPLRCQHLGLSPHFLLSPWCIFLLV